MNVYQDIEALPPFQNAVLTIGTFDGVHRGHQALLQRINGLAKQAGGESVLVTFHPHPRFVLNPGDTSLKLLNTIDEKLELLAKYQLDNVVVTPFTKAFASQPATEYVSRFLVGRFQPKRIVIGYDHRFGKDRSGDIDLLKSLAPQFGYSVEEISKQTVEDIAVSSTKVRKALLEGRVEHANEWLGHTYALSGRIIKGDQIGRTIGFPTANIQMEHHYKLIPAKGVYAVSVEVAGKQHFGMLNIGFRPTFEGVSKTIEVHLFDWTGDIYGEVINVRFLHWLRGERKFESKEALILQLKQDETKARRLLLL